jgi:dsRNA-specific ribonuclease
MATYKRQDIQKYPPAIRGTQFQDFISGLLLKIPINPLEINELITPDNMKLFETAFTHTSAGKKSDYERLELLGDSIVNTSIVFYLNERFPKIAHKGKVMAEKDTVKILTRMKGNLASGKTLGRIAQQLDFWKYVDATDYFKSTKMIPLLEDCFEAFCGVLTTILDREHGFKICYNLITNLLNDLEMDIDYDKLFDAKTRLKELYDKIRWGNPRFVETIPRTDEHRYFTIGAIGRVPKKGYKWGDVIGEQAKVEAYIEQVIGTGKAPLKKKAQTNAAQYALEFLKKQGVERMVTYGDGEDD